MRRYASDNPLGPAHHLLLRGVNFVLLDADMVFLADPQPFIHDAAVDMTVSVHLVSPSLTDRAWTFGPCPRPAFSSVSRCSLEEMQSWVRGGVAGGGPAGRRGGGAPRGGAPPPNQEERGCVVVTWPREQS